MNEISRDAPDDVPHRRPALRVVVDDLAFIDADAILRPADAMLGPVTAAATRLDHLAGATFLVQRQVASPLELGAAVVTGGGDLTAPFVIHLVLRDDRATTGPDVIRRALVSAWRRAKDWGLARLATSLVGAGAGQLGVEDAAILIAETFTAAREPGDEGELCLVLEREGDLEIVDAAVRRYA